MTPLTSGQSLLTNISVVITDICYLMAVAGRFLLVLPFSSICGGRLSHSAPTEPVRPTPCQRAAGHSSNYSVDHSSAPLLHQPVHSKLSIAYTPCFVQVQFESCGPARWKSIILPVTSIYCRHRQHRGGEIEKKENYTLIE